MLGYTDHSQAHTAFVAERAAYILEELGYTGREIELAKIAGFMHDIHDRVNYAVTKSDISFDKEKKNIVLNLSVDEEICSMYEYFEIFLTRMMMCRGAAEILGVGFKLRVNGDKVL